MTCIHIWYVIINFCTGIVNILVEERTEEGAAAKQDNSMQATFTGFSENTKTVTLKERQIMKQQIKMETSNDAEYEPSTYWSVWRV